MTIHTEYEGIKIEYIESPNIWVARDNGEFGDSPQYSSLREVKEWIDRKLKQAKNPKKKAQKIKALFRDHYSSLSDDLSIGYITSKADNKYLWATDSKGKRGQVWADSVYRYDDEKYKRYLELRAEERRIQKEFDGCLDPFDGSVFDEVEAG